MYLVTHHIYILIIRIESVLCYLFENEQVYIR